jgi:2-methylcitrate dehydratase PrpD
LQSFEEEFLNLPDVRDLMSRVKVVASSDLDRHFPKYWPGAVAIQSAGKTYSEAVMIPKGESGNPMGQLEVREKFVSLAVPVIGAANAEAVVQEIEALDGRKFLDGLLNLLKPPT